MPSKNDGPVDMDIGVLKGRKGYKGKGMIKGKGKDSRAKEYLMEKEKERATRRQVARKHD